MAGTTTTASTAPAQPGRLLFKQTGSRVAIPAESRYLPRLDDPVGHADAITKSWAQVSSARGR